MNSDGAERGATKSANSKLANKPNNWVKPMPISCGNWAYMVKLDFAWITVALVASKILH
jgi:hypothetical protein